jgi:ketosteroid isomerase-like protein
MSTSPLQASELIALAERYFAAVDRMDVAATLACFAPDARFTIATYSNVYEGRDIGIAGMFERLNERYAKVWHGDFDHVTDVPEQRIASRFRVENGQEQLQLLSRAGRPFCRGLCLHEWR